MEQLGFEMAPTWDSGTAGCFTCHSIAGGPDPGVLGQQLGYMPPEALSQSGTHCLIQGTAQRSPVLGSRTTLAFPLLGRVTLEFPSVYRSDIFTQGNPGAGSLPKYSWAKGRNQELHLGLLCAPSLARGHKLARGRVGRV